LIVTPQVIDESVSISLIHDVKRGLFVNLMPNQYALSKIAAEGFSRVCSREDKYNDFLHESIDIIDFDNEIWKDFWLYVTVNWLTRLSVTELHFTGLRKHPPKIDINWLETAHIPKELKQSNIFMKYVAGKHILSYAYLIPFETLKFKLEKNQVIIKYTPMKITISYRLTQNISGIDLRISSMLGIPQKDLSNYETISGFIRFKAEFGAKSIFYRKSDKYYVLAKQLLENLRANYGWNEYIEDLKEYVYWLHVCKITDLYEL
jgi:hypothetical protein